MYIKKLLLRAPDPEPPKAKADEPTEPPKEEPKEDFKETIEKLKKGFDEKIAKLTADYKKEVQERDDVINQLMNGDPQPIEEKSVADKINERRKARLKIW